MPSLTLDQQYYLLAGLVLLLPAIPIAFYLRGRLRRAPQIPPDPRPVYQGPPLSPEEAIAETRLILGPPRAGRVTPELLAQAPRWMSRSDPLRGIFNVQRELLDEGHVIWGCIVQANQLLFEPGQFDSPAALIYSADPSFDGRPEELSWMAADLFETKGRDDVPDDLRRFSFTLADEVTRDPRLKVPTRLTQGREVYYTSIMVVRGHLPDGVLRRPIVPLLVLPERTPWTMIVPSHFWSPSLVREWSASGDD